MSTIKVSNIQNASTSSGGIAIDTSGHVTVDGVAYPSAGSLSGRNRIINGDMRIDQRNAGASVNMSAVVYPVDRWAAFEDTDGAMTAQRSTTAPVGFANSIVCTTTTADASLAAAQYARVWQNLEGLNVADLMWGTANAQSISVSFWVRSSLTGTFGGSVANSAFNRSYPFVYTISAVDTWEYKTVVIAGDTTGTWLTDNSTGLQLNFGLGAGSTFSGTAGSWAGTGYVSATGATSVVGTNGATFYITGVQLEVGSVATPFEHRSYGDELARCQRYFERRNLNDNGNTEGIFGIGNSISTSSSKLLYYWNIEKRSSASISLTLDGGVLYVRDAFNSSQGTNQSFTVEATSSSHAVLTFTSNGGTFTAGAPGQVRVDQLGSGNAYFSISAEL